MPSTGIIRVEMRNAEQVCQLLNQYLKQYPHLEIISVSHTVLSNNTCSALVALRDLRAQEKNAKQDSDNSFPPVMGTGNGEA